MSGDDAVINLDVGERKTFIDGGGVSFSQDEKCPSPVQNAECDLISARASSRRQPTSSNSEKEKKGEIERASLKLIARFPFPRANARVLAHYYSTAGPRKKQRKSA